MDIYVVLFRLSYGRCKDQKHPIDVIITIFQE